VACLQTPAGGVEEVLIAKARFPARGSVNPARRWSVNRRDAAVSASVRSMRPLRSSSYR
jgi:hypothetical protein